MIIKHNNHLTGKPLGTQSKYYFVFLPRSRHLKTRCALILLPPLIQLLALATIGWGADFIPTVERTFSIQGRPKLVIRNVAGSIEIAGGSQSQVILKATKEVRHAPNQTEALMAAERAKLRIEQIGDRIEIEARQPRASIIGSEPHVLTHIVITAPSGSDLDVKNGDGDLLVSRVQGLLQLSAAGDVEVRNCRGFLRTQSATGTVTVTGLQGEADVVTTEGRIAVDGILTGLSAKSSDGRVEITARAGSTMVADWNIRTREGTVRLALPEGFQASLDISAADGEIDSEHPVKIERAGRGHRLIGKLGGGAKLLRIRTTGGDVFLTKS